MNNLSRIKALLVATALVVANNFGTATAAEPKFIDHLTSATCAGFFPPILTKPELAPILAERNIEGQTICACGRARVEADGRLTEYFALENEALIKRLQNEERLRAYVIARVVHSLLQCLATEMDASLSASTAVK